MYITSHSIRIVLLSRYLNIYGTMAPMSELYVVIKRGEKSLLVECHNAIYGTMVAGLLYYRKFTSSLKERGFEMNPYDPCVWNKTIRGKQLTICFHVDDCKISHVNVRVVDYTIDWLRKEYESIFTDGSGKMKVARQGIPQPHGEDDICCKTGKARHISSCSVPNDESQGT